jgi:hypothetical protein
LWRKEKLFVDINRRYYSPAVIGNLCINSLTEKGIVSPKSSAILLMLTGNEMPLAISMSLREMGGFGFTTRLIHKLNRPAQISLVICHLSSFGSPFSGSRGLNDFAVSNANANILVFFH